MVSNKKKSNVKKKKTAFQDSIKYVIGFVFCLLFRLIPFKVPNIEPVMGTMMPFAKRGKWIVGFLFGFISMVLFDMITMKIGVWTWVTAVMYGLIGAFAGVYLSGKENKARYYIGFSIVATLIYDAVTGIGIGMLFFHQTFMVTFLGQIPFTLWHLLGNIVFAGLLSPLLYTWVAENKWLEVSTLFSSFKQKSSE